MTNTRDLQLIGIGLGAITFAVVAVAALLVGTAAADIVADPALIGRR